MQPIFLFQLGLGNVGKALLRGILEYNSTSGEHKLIYMGMANRNSGLFISDGINADLLKLLSTDVKPSLLNLPSAFAHNGDLPGILDRIRKLAPANVYIVDTTDSVETTTFLQECVREGFAVILANKKPLTQDLSIFHGLFSPRLGCRATVGAGLAVIPAIQNLLSQHKTITKIEACLSGSLGTLCCALERGKSFSDSLKDCVEKGYTEPDPRQDLSGSDVARKILIIARICGYPIEFDDVQVEGFMQPTPSETDLGDFMNSLARFDRFFQDKFSDARRRSMTLRYVARMESDQCSTALVEVPLNSELGKLGPGDKAVVISTQQDPEPTVVRGQGAGAQTAASDMLRDILDLSPRHHRKA